MTSDENLRKLYAAQIKRPVKGLPRAVYVDVGFVLHPEDRDAQLTRMPDRRNKTTK